MRKIKDRTKLFFMLHKEKKHVSEKNYFISQGGTLFFEE